MRRCVELKLKAYILTVDTAGGSRHSHALGEAAKLGLPWQFVEGARIDANSVPPEYSRLLNFLFYRRRMSSGEISVYLGHRQAWQQLLDDRKDYGLILEDDFQVIDEDRLRGAIEDAVSSPGDWDLIKFFDIRSKPVMASTTLGSTKFVCRRCPPNGAVAYLINDRAARALLSRKRIFRPVDEDISRPWEFKLRVWSSERNLVTENSGSLGGSLLEEAREEEEIQQRRNPLRNIIIRNALKLCKLISSRKHVDEIKRSVQRIEG